MKKGKKNLLYNLWSLGIVVCSGAVIFSILLAACTGETKSKDNTSKPTDPMLTSGAPETTVLPDASATNEVTAPVYNGPVELQETEDMGQEYIDKFIFLGDSTTNGLRAYGVLKDQTETKQVWVPANETFSLFLQENIRILYPETREELTIEEILERKKPEYMMITLGVNGIALMDEKYFVSEYTKLVTRIQAQSPDTKIILNSIYPVATNYKELKDINNEKIDTANMWVKQIAENTGTRFLNSASILKDESGWLRDDYQNGDGIHLQPVALNKVLEYLRTHGYQ